MLKSYVPAADGPWDSVQTGMALYFDEAPAPTADSPLAMTSPRPPSLPLRMSTLLVAWRGLDDGTTLTHTASASKSAIPGA